MTFFPLSATYGVEKALSCAFSMLLAVYPLHIQKHFITPFVLVVIFFPLTLFPFVAKLCAKAAVKLSGYDEKFFLAFMFDGSICMLHSMD
jgi:hypothetical protein